MEVNMKKLLISVFVSTLSVLTLMGTGTVKANVKTFGFDENSSKTIQLSNDLTAIENKKQRVNLLNLIQYHIDYAMEDAGQRKIERIKELKDFTGSVYTLFELDPIGYIIYHNDSGIVFEYASKSESPYLGYNDNLYYGGMMNYFYKENDIYYNTLIKYETVLEEESKYLIDNSSIIYNRNLESMNQTNLDFISGKTDVVSSWKSEEEIVLLATNDQPNISMEAFFKPLTTQYSMGYTTVGKSGVCGYIAANLVLAYNTLAYDDALVSDTYLDKTNRKLKGSALTRELIRQHGKDPDADSIAGTTADSMGDCVRNYLKNVSSGTKSWKVTTWWGTINSQGAIKKNQPPILFGNIKYPESSSSTYEIMDNATSGDGAHGSGNHAVVAYGYTSSKYRVHYGWSGYSDVILSYNAIGGTMILSYF